MVPVKPLLALLGRQLSRLASIGNPLWPRDHAECCVYIHCLEEERLSTWLQVPRRKSGAAGIRTQGSTAFWLWWQKQDKQRFGLASLEDLPTPCEVLALKTPSQNNAHDHL